MQLKHSGHQILLVYKIDPLSSYVQMLWDGTQAVL